MGATPRRRDLVEILDAHERSIKRLAQTLARTGGGGAGFGEYIYTLGDVNLSGLATGDTLTATLETPQEITPDPTPSSEFDSANVGNVLDDSTSTYWTVLMNQVGYIDFDFGQAVTLNQIKMRSGISYWPTSLKIQTSSDGVVWADWATYGVTFQANSWIDFDFSPKSARYWRLQETQTGALYWRLYEVQFWNSPAEWTPKAHALLAGEGATTTAQQEFDTPLKIENVLGGTGTDDAQLRLTKVGDVNSVLFRNDGADFWMLVTDSEDGSWNTLRPFRFNNTTGMAYMDNGATVKDGTAAAPGIRLSTNAHGLYRFDASNIGIAANGAAAIIASSGGVTVMGDYLYFNGVTGTEYLQFADASNYARIVLDGSETWRTNTSGQSLAGNGSSGAPSHSFIGDTNTGFYRHAENTIGVALGAAARAFFQVPTANGSAGLAGGATFQSGAVSLDVLGSTSGNIQRRGTFFFDVGGNNTSIEVQAVRDANGSDWTTAAVGFRRVTDATSQASLWLYQSRVGINKSGPQWTLEVAGTFGAAPSSTTSTSGNRADWFVGATGTYQLYRYTSSKRLKREIDYDTAYLADYTLKPVTFFGIGEHDYDANSIGFIAEDVANNDKRLGTYNEDGEVEVFSDIGVLAILAAKANRAEAERDEFRGCLERLEAQVAELLAET